jgi:hypothetical protein
VVENLKSKTLYKIELGLLKVIPMILALTALLNSILSYFGIDLYILSYIGGVSIFTMLFLYLSSYVFKFCEYYRMFLHYIVSTWIINIIDYYVGIPISDLEYLCLQMIIAGISLFIILYLYVKSHKKPTIKDSR